MPKVPRGYTRLVGSERTPRKGATRVAPADPAETTVVSIYLRKPADAPPLPSQEDYVNTPPSERTPLTREELAERYAAGDEDIAAVTAFAEKAGLTVVATAPERRLVQVSGTNAQLAKAFGVELAVYQSDRERYRGREGHVYIPKSLEGVIEGVFGLDNRRMARRSGTGGGAVPVTPPQVAQAYNFPSPAGGASGETVAILEFSGPTTDPVDNPTCGFAQSDIDGFINNLNATTGSHLVSTTVNSVTVDHSAAAPGNVPGSATNFTPQDADVEVALDIEIVVAVAQQANVVVYFAPITEQGWVDAITQIVADTTNDPSVLSISWGWTEQEADAFIGPDDPSPPAWPFEWSQTAFNQMTAAFQSAAAIGMTVLVATGDNGSDCQEHDGNAHVQYPASDPWVIACGGTIVNSTSPLSEDTWNDNNSSGQGGATGGGISYLVDPVPWQAGANVPQSVNSDHRHGRGIPDVAGNASPNSGYDLWLYGQSSASLAFTSPASLAGFTLGAVGGTSAVAPLYAALIALINANLQTRVGYINPILYQLGSSSVFRDINDGVSNAVTWVAEDGTVGGPSAGYTSGPGWDPCTGLGSIDGTELMNACAVLFQKQLSFYMEQSTFSQDEVELQLPGTATFAAGWIALDNFLPSQLGLTTANLAHPPASSVPTITFTPDATLPPAVASALAGMIEPPTASGPVLAVDPTLPDRPQRFLFPFTIKFRDDSGFLAMSAASVISALGALSASLTVSTGSFSNSTPIELTTGEDPRFEDINPADPTTFPSWESFDLRVFKMTVPAGGHASRFGATVTGASDAPAFIATAMANLSAGSTGTDTFDSLFQDENQSSLEFNQQDDSGNYVYNFALARVRLTAENVATAQAVRVFFRLFQAQNTTSNFDDSATYRYYTDGMPFGHRIPLLGVGHDQHGNAEYVTIPCFATERITVSDPTQGMQAQTDTPNAHDLVTDPSLPDHEKDYYFGCWIDNNQPYGIMPASFPSGTVPAAGQASSAFDGPWPGVTLEPMKTALTAFPHQCLIAEIRYDDTPIPAGVTTATSDKLAQRNIAWLDAPNPGVAASRRVTHPVQVRSTQKSELFADELMITWGDTPRGSKAELYLPAVPATEIMQLTALDEGDSELYIVEANTIGFATADVTFVPLPYRSAFQAGLLTIELPPGIRKGESYTIGVRQFSAHKAKLPTPPPTPQIEAAAREGGIAVWRQLDGAFQFAISVSTKDQLLLGEERLLAVLRWMALHTPANRRWYPVLIRYISEVAGRVLGFGGDPGKIKPSPIGQVPGWPPREHGHHGVDDDGFVGKIVRLIYDHFGDFEGFALELESGGRRDFYSREPLVRELAHQAWSERTRVAVFEQEGRHHVPRTIELVI